MWLPIFLDYHALRTQVLVSAYDPHVFCLLFLKTECLPYFPNEMPRDEGLPRELWSLKSASQLDICQAQCEHSGKIKEHIDQKRKWKKDIINLKHN